MVNLKQKLEADVKKNTKLENANILSTEEGMRRAVQSLIDTVQDHENRIINLESK